MIQLCGLNFFTLNSLTLSRKRMHRTKSRQNSQVFFLHFGPTLAWFNMPYSFFRISIYTKAERHGTVALYRKGKPKGIYLPPIDLSGGFILHLCITISGPIILMVGNHPYVYVHIWFLHQSYYNLPTIYNKWCFCWTSHFYLGGLTYYGDAIPNISHFLCQNASVQLPNTF
jgi:hypothetical protein